VDQAILGLLLSADEQRPWSQRELELEIGSAIDVEDSLARLRAASLVHRCGEFAWVSRAALNAQRLMA
jgi:hypothetical protein